MAGRLNRGDVRFVRLPSPDKARPALVLTRESVIPVLTSVTIAPITSTIRGVASEVLLGVEDGLKHPCAVNLHGVMTVHRRFVGRLITSLNNHKMRQVCSALAYSLGCT